MARKIKGGIKRRETDPASNQFPKYSPRTKIAGRNINNLRYADDTTLMAESEEELSLGFLSCFIGLWTVLYCLNDCGFVV